MAGCETPRPWRFEEVLGVLAGALKFGINPSLDTVTSLCEALGRPQDALEVVQVAGTNGKTSTARYAAALIAAEGRRTALYTSPELERYPERMEIDGAVVSDEDFALAVGVAIDTAAALFGRRADGVPERATEFELLTAAALWLFRERRVEVAVLEVGLGGRWDATSVAVPRVAVVTGVGLDHMHVLGDTLEQIAAEKGAIVRDGALPVLGPGTAGVEAVFFDAAEEAGSRALVRAVRESAAWSPVEEALTVRFRVAARPGSIGGATVVDVRAVNAAYDGLALAAPSYQAANLATAIAVAEGVLGGALDSGRVRRALAGLTIPGRFELVRARPPIVVDGSHNPQAAEVLAAAIGEAWPDPEHRPLVLLGVLADKDARGIVAALVPVAAGFAVAAPESPRALPAAQLAAIVETASGVPPAVFDSLTEALGALRPRAEHGLVVTGSLTTAGQARSLLRRGDGRDTRSDSGDRQSSR